jgi:hypothetical protein
VGRTDPGQQHLPIGQGGEEVSFVGAVALLVLLLVALEVFFWALKKDLFGIALFKLGISLRRRLPIGRYRWERENSIAVGKPDTVVVFKMPLHLSADQRPVTYVAVTDSATRFSVGDDVVAVDPFLEAYDDELGPLEIQVYEAGKIATIAIDSATRRAEQPRQPDAL